jgi:hypothetical protein
MNLLDRDFVGMSAVVGDGWSAYLLIPNRNDADQCALENGRVSFANVFAGGDQVRRSRCGDCFGQTVVVPDYLLHVCLIQSIAVAAVGRPRTARSEIECWLSLST